MRPNRSSTRRSVRAYVGLVEAHGYEILDSVDADATVRVRITFFNPDDLDYKIDVDISAGSEIVRLEPLDCPQCVDEDLLAKIESQREEVLAGIEKALAREDRPPGSGVDGDGDDPDDRIAPIGPMGAVGISVLGAGIGLTIWGSVELGRGEVFDNRPGAPRLTGQDHGPRGQILLGTGIASVAIGGALLVTDVVLRAKQRKRNRSGAAVPMITPTSVGLAWVAQF